MKPARTRFAPSPTGFLHVGGVRTALFAWLIARQSSGQFILRLEDTDKAREVSGSDQHIMDSLRWLGLLWDEGPDIGGDHGPYRQSQRLSIYQEWAQKLYEKGRAYSDPYTVEQLEDFRQQAKLNKQPFLFRNHRPENPPDWKLGTPLRFSSDPKAYQWHDEVLGDLSSGPEVIDDFVIMKSDGYPTYNFAHIIDDHLMLIDYVIRSQEFTSSVPKYLNLYDAFGLEWPHLATLPYVMGPDGKKKLSKRDGAKDVLDYAKEGYLPEALVNFLATLGWNDGSEQEIFSREQLIETFKLSRVQKSGANFDEQRLIWMNGYYIRQLTLSELLSRCRDFWPPEAAAYDDDYKIKVLALVQERLKFLAELPSLTNFFFSNLPVDMSLIEKSKQLAQFSHQQLSVWLQISKQELGQSDFSLDDLQARLNKLLETTQQKPAVLFSLIRIATTQAPFSPALADTLSVLGKQKSLERIDITLSALL
jgi:glutamyl-tRNA synthetase